MEYIYTSGTLYTAQRLLCSQEKANSGCGSVTHRVQRMLASNVRRTGLCLGRASSADYTKVSWHTSQGWAHWDNSARGHSDCLSNCFSKFALILSDSCLSVPTHGMQGLKGLTPLGHIALGWALSGQDFGDGESVNIQQQTSCFM